VYFDIWRSSSSSSFKIALLSLHSASLKLSQISKDTREF
jgi:hypothetical protein